MSDLVVTAELVGGKFFPKVSSDGGATFDRLDVGMSSVDKAWSHGKDVLVSVSASQVRMHPFSVGVLMATMIISIAGMLIANESGILASVIVGVIFALIGGAPVLVREIVRRDRIKDLISGRIVFR